MTFLSSINPGYPLSGFVIGMLVGLTGVGGGSLMTPILVLVFGINPATAVGTDLLFASVTKSVGSLVHGANATVDWRVVARLAAGSVPATALTLLMLSRLGPMGAGGAALISTMLGSALIRPAVTVICRQASLDFPARRPAPRAPAPPA